MFEIDRLDHVAIRVKDLDASVAWYTKVLGLKKYQLEKWGDYPIFMLSGKAGIALFPANAEHPQLDSKSKNVKIDHFAFHVSKENLEKVFDKGKEFVEDLVEGDEESVPEQKIEKTPEPEAVPKKSARDRFKDKGMIK